MNCSETLAQLDAYLDGDLGAAACSAIEAHIGRCPGCRTRLAQARALADRLKALPVAPPAAGFEARVLRRANRQGRVAGLRNGWLTAALAASLVGGVGIGLKLDRPEVPESTPQRSVAMVPQTQQTVRLLLSTPSDVPVVTYTVSLPDGVELAGYPGRREISWRGELKAGNNLLNLPLVARSSRGGVLVTRISEGQRSKTFTLDIRVQVPQPAGDNGGYSSA